MAESKETNVQVAHEKALLVLLNNIIDDNYPAPVIRDYAEAYAMMTGRLNQPVRVKNV